MRASINWLFLYYLFLLAYIVDLFVFVSFKFYVYGVWIGYILKFYYAYACIY